MRLRRTMSVVPLLDSENEDEETEQTRWGKEVVCTGFRMHARGWASMYCMPARPAFRSYAACSHSEMLAGSSRRATAAMGTLLSRHRPVWASVSGDMRLLQRLAYANRVAYPLASLPLTVYCTISVVCLLAGKSIFPNDVGGGAPRGVPQGTPCVRGVTVAAAALEWDSSNLSYQGGSSRSFVDGRVGAADRHASEEGGEHQEPYLHPSRRRVGQQA